MPSSETIGCAGIDYFYVEIVMRAGHKRERRKLAHTVIISVVGKRPGIRRRVVE